MCIRDRIYVDQERASAFTDAVSVFGLNNVVGTPDNRILNSAAFGVRNRIEADTGVAFGEDNTITSAAENSVAIGEGNSSGAERGVAIGENNSVLVGSNDGIAIGSEIIVDNFSAVAMGRGARGLGIRSLTLSAEFEYDSEEAVGHENLFISVTNDRVSITGLDAATEITNTYDLSLIHISEPTRPY